MFKRFARFCSINRIELKYVLWYVVLCLCVELFCFFYEYHTLNMLSGQPSVVEGPLVGVYRTNPRRIFDNGYEIYIGEDSVSYTIVHRDFDKKNYGIRDDITLAEYGDILKRKIGSQARVEYIQTAEKTKEIMRLTIDGDEYIDARVARNDQLVEKRETLYWIMVSFVITIAVFIFVLQCLRIQKQL